MAHRHILLACTLLVLAVGVVGQSTSRSVFFGNYNAPPDYGFDYLEDVESEDDYYNSHEFTHPDPHPTWTRYVLDGSSTNFAYLGVNLDGRGHDKESYTVAFRILGQQNDGRESGFTAAFSMEDAFNKGDGKITGSFYNIVKVKFRESGNDWSLELTEVVNGNERSLVKGGTHGSNEHRLFHLHVDNRADSGPRVELQDYAGTRILAASTSSSFAGKVVHSQWYVAYSYEGDSKAYTLLAANDPSTRIYDADPQPPVVESVEFIPNPPSPGEALAVQSTITDDWLVERAVIFYRVNGGAAQQVEMTHPSGNLWTGTIPGQAADSHVVVRIEAYDDEDLVGHSEGEYSYTVGSGSAIDRDDNSEIPDPPGDGGVDEDEPRLGTAEIVMAVIGAAIGLGFAYLAYTDGHPQRAVSILGGTILVVGAFLLFRANPGGVKELWFALAAALAIPPAIAAARAWARKQRQGPGGG